MFMVSGIGGFNAMMALSTRNEDPKTSRLDHLIKIETVSLWKREQGALVLEEYEHVKKRGQKIYRNSRRRTYCRRAPYHRSSSGG